MRLLAWSRGAQVRMSVYTPHRVYVTCWFGFSGSNAQADETVLHALQYAGRHEALSEQGSQHTQLHPRQLYSVSSVYSYVRRLTGRFAANFAQ